MRSCYHRSHERKHNRIHNCIHKRQEQHNAEIVESVKGNYQGFDDPERIDPRWLFVAPHAIALVAAAVQGYNHAQGMHFPNSTASSAFYYGAPLAQVGVTTSAVVGSLFADQIKDGRVKNFTSAIKMLKTYVPLTGALSGVLAGLEFLVGYGAGYTAGTISK